MTTLIQAGTDVTTDPSAIVPKTDNYPYYALEVQVVWTTGTASDAKMYIEGSLDGVNWDSESLIEGGIVVDYLTLDMTSNGSATAKIFSTGKIRVRIDKGTNGSGTVQVNASVKNLQNVS